MNKRKPWHKCVEEHGDKWTVSRWEGPTMRVHVGIYDHKWEAEEAAQIAKADWDELSALVSLKKAQLRAVIDDHLDLMVQQQGLPRSVKPKTKRERRAADAYAGAKQLKK